MKPNASHSIFEDTISTDIEDYNITYDFEEWSSYLEQELQELRLECHTFFDKSTASKISKYFKGFMLGPVAAIDNQVVIAKTLAVMEFDKFSLLEMEPEELYLYSLSFHYSFPNFYSVDEQTFQPVSIETPIFNKSMWKMRYGTKSNDRLTNIVIGNLDCGRL